MGLCENFNSLLCNILPLDNDEYERTRARGLHHDLSIKDTLSKG